MENNFAVGFQLRRRRRRRQKLIIATQKTPRHWRGDECCDYSPDEFHSRGILDYNRDLPRNDRWYPKVGFSAALKTTKLSQALLINFLKKTVPMDIGAEVYNLMSS